MTPTIRPLTEADRETWTDMRASLWPDHDREELAAEITTQFMQGKERAWIAETGGHPVAFIEIGLRDYVDGATASPVPHVEGIWVAPGHRRHGIAASLIAHVSAILTAEGFTELTSDVEVLNAPSHAAHKTWGFTETDRVVYYRKPLGQTP